MEKKPDDGQADGADADAQDYQAMKRKKTIEEDEDEN